MSYTALGCQAFVKELESPAFQIHVAPMVDRDAVSVVFKIPAGAFNPSETSLGLEFSGVQSAGQRRVEDVARALNSAYNAGMGLMLLKNNKLLTMLRDIEDAISHEDVTTAAKVAKIEHLLAEIDLS